MLNNLSSANDSSWGNSESFLNLILIGHKVCLDDTRGRSGDTLTAGVPAFCLIQDSLWGYQCYLEPACGDEVDWACSMSASSHFLADSTFIVSIQQTLGTSDRIPPTLDSA